MPRRWPLRACQLLLRPISLPAPDDPNLWLKQFTALSKKVNFPEKYTTSCNHKIISNLKIQVTFF
jgi:hypothetical protein